MRNSQRGGNKLSKLERQINKLILSILCTQLVICAVALFFAIFYFEKQEDLWYLPDLGTFASYGIITFLSYFLLINTMIPISLIVSLEVVKIVQAFFLN